MPLYKNGQSELYVEDILKIDPRYTPEQARTTRTNIVRKQYPDLKVPTQEDLRQQRESDELVGQLEQAFGGLIRLYKALQLRFASPSVRQRHQLVSSLLKDVQAERSNIESWVLQQQARAQRKALMAELFLDQERPLKPKEAPPH